MERLPEAAFHPFSPSHLAVLGILAGLALALMALTRLRRLRAVRAVELVLAVMLLGEWPFNAFVSSRVGLLHPGNALPLHLCDVAAILGGLALITHQAELCELLYFWGLAGTLQGLITPALVVDWPHPRFVMFFLLHCGVVLAAIHLVFARGNTPRRGAVRRAVGWILVYAAVAGTANAIIRACGAEANYGFLCEKPPTASLLDFLGPWPWYVGSLIALSWVFFSILDLPFALRRGVR